MEWAKKFEHSRNEWTSGHYSITEVKREFDEFEYLCYKNNNFIGAMVTIENAKELCEAWSGKE